jgi:diguanylate cyclase (GGDEF)-like protein/PAS domain S-box-containing protein
MAAPSPVAGLAAGIMQDADLATVRGSEQAGPACWVQDVDEFRVHWANEAAAELLDAASVEELYSRDLRPVSKASLTRLHIYRKRALAGSPVVTQWTTFPRGRPVTILAEIRAFRFVDERIGLFFAARSIADETCAETLRMLEAARQSTAAFAIYSFDGKLLERNAAFLRMFGDLSDSPTDGFTDLFFDEAESLRIRGTVSATGEHRGRTLLLTRHGPRWHMVNANRILDPVDGSTVIHFESVDIHDQVEAEIRAREAETLLQRISDEFPHPVAYVGHDRRFRFINRTYSRWLQRPQSEIIGKTIDDVAGSEAAALWSEHWKKVERRERTSYERRTNYAGNGERWTRVDMMPFVDDQHTVKGAFVFGYDVHTLRLAEQSAQATEAELRLIADGLPLAICKYDREERVNFVNEPFCRWFGLRRAAMLGRRLRELVSPEYYISTTWIRERTLEGEVVQIREPMMRGDKQYWFDITVSPARLADGTIDGFLAIYSDVTRKVEAKAALNEARTSLASHIENTPLAVIQLDGELCIKQWSGRATEILSWNADEVMGRTLVDMRMFEPESRLRFDEQMRALESGRHERFTAQFRTSRRDGSTLHAEWYVSVLRDEKSAVTSYFLLVHDVSARIAAEGHLQYVANHDLLTGLANRTQFRERLEKDMQRLAPLGHHLAVLQINVDRFKYVNDNLGHQAGDNLLKLVGTRLKAAMRDVDLLARSGGDEFMALLELAEHPQRAGAMADAVVRALAAPFHSAGQDIFVTASVGVSLFPEDGDNPNELLKNADWAMFRAKDAGRNNIQFFARAAAGERPFRLSTEAELRRAIERDELLLYFQPKLSIATGLLVGAEVLVRWRHSMRGLVPPDLFIPLAEDTGLIVDIGAWVFAATCRQLAAWREEFGRLTQLAINLSAVQLRRRTLANDLLQQMRKHNLPGSALMVEVTETALVTDPILAADTLEALRAEGVHSAIDDFGKGFSSLMQLKRLPIDELKIDSSFIHEIAVDRDDAAIVQAIIGLAHNLDLRVVAEGVETKEQLQFLREAKCDEAQGYLIARPMPAADFAAHFLVDRTRQLIA